MEHCCYVWVGAPNYYLRILHKKQKQLSSNVGPSLAASIEPLAH